MNFKRLFFYLALNVIVSATTILIVLNIWDRIQRPETPTSEPVSLLPTVLASAVPPTQVPTFEPTMATRPYEVGLGETLSEIAQLFGVNVQDLMEINDLNDPDEISTGMILDVPISGNISQTDGNPPQADAGPVIEPTLTATLLPVPENSDIKIVTIVGVDDLATEHLQIQSVSAEPISLDGWRLETNDGLVYIFPKITLFEYGAVDLFSRAGINSVVALYWGRSSPIFQSGDRAVIYDSEGNVQAVYSIP